jgi:hypothetical protein
MTTGDPTKAALWTGADVFIAPLGTAGPTDLTTAWDVAFEAAGLLDGDEGFTWARAEDTSDFYAWGGLLIRTTRSKHKRTVQFVALEDNDVTFDLVNPGSTRGTPVSGVRTSSVKVPQYTNFMIGFELRDGAKTTRRYCKNATVQEVAEIKESESAPTVYNVTVVLYPEADGTLFTEVSNS